MNKLHDEVIVRCAGCMFWDNSETNEEIPDKLKGKYGTCSNSAFNEGATIDDRTDLLIYSHYICDEFPNMFSGASFDTGANFGCIHGRMRS